MNKTAAALSVLAACAICRAEETPLSAEWKLPGGKISSSRIIELSPDKCEGNIMAIQRISGPFEAGTLLRFSADTETSEVKDDKGQEALRPFDLNLHPRNVCLALAQLDEKGRTLSVCGSARLLGTGKTRLELEVPVQQSVGAIELRLMATLVTGDIRYRNMRLEKLPDEPLQEVPEAKILTNSNGSCFWQIDGKTRPLALYFGNNQFNRDDRILAEMEKAVGAGVPVLSFNLYLPSMVSNTEQLKLIERFMKPFPDAYFIPRVWLGPGEAYQKSFPEELMKYADGHTGSYASASSEHWKNFTDNNLRELVKLIRRSPYSKQFAGLKLTYHQTGEWIYWDPHLSAGYDEPTRQSFTRWLENKYGTKFENVTVPTEEERNTGAFGEFRDPKTQQRVIDFSLFYNTANADSIIRFARTVKEATGNRSLTAAFYGYLFELAWDENWPQQGGHLGLEKLYNSPYIDIIGAPYSYNPIGRGFGLPVDLHGPFDGINRYGKVAMIEEDTFTHLAEEVPEVVKGYAPGYASRTMNMEETLAVLRRDLGVAVAHNQLVVWQNLFSEGRFNEQQIWDMYKPYLSWMQQRAETTRPFQPQVAVLASAENITLLKNKAYGITERWLYQNRFPLNRVDASIGYYLQTDLAQLPESVRCVVLLNPYRITDEEKAILKERFMRDGKMIVFCGVPDVYDDSGFNPDGTGFCGIQLELKKESFFPESKTEDGLVFGDRQFGHQKKQPVELYLTVKDRDADPLASYSSTREVSCAVKEMKDWISVYLGSPGLPPELWRDLFKKAGCHLYFNRISADFNKPDFIQASSDFLMVQSATGGERKISLPETVRAVYRLDGPEPELTGENCDAFRARLSAGIPAFFIFQKK